MPKTKRRRVPPQRIPVSKQDLDRTQKKATSFAITYCWAVMFSVMRDKFGWGPVRLMRLWQETIGMSESIREGYVKIDDLVKTLEEESGIVLEDFKF